MFYFVVVVLLLFLLIYLFVILFTFLFCICFVVVVVVVVCLFACVLILLFFSLWYFKSVSSVSLSEIHHPTSLLQRIQNVAFVPVSFHNKTNHPPSVTIHLAPDKTLFFFFDRKVMVVSLFLYENICCGTH